MKKVMSIPNYKMIVAAALVASQVALPASVLAGPVRIGGQQAFSVDTASGGMTASARSTSIQKNIDNALVAASDHTPASVGIVYVKGQPILTLGGFYVATVDAASAKAAKTTTPLLAQKWANGMKTALKDQSSIDAYIAQLNGSTTGSAGSTTTSAGSYGYYKQGRIVYVPAGMTMAVALKSALSSESARAGDPVEAQLTETVNLGDAAIPQGSTLIGTITDAQAGKRMGHAGTLGMKFDTLRTPDGQVVPITAHIVGGVGTYEQIGTQSNTIAGETSKDKMKQALIRGAVGAGGGAVLGTAIGAIAGHGRGAGRGALAGTAIGGALGVAQSLLVRKGKDVSVASGQGLNLQLDAPASLAVSSSQL